MWKNIEDYKKCLEMWEKEAECRDRKNTFKQMAKVDKKETENVEKNVIISNLTINFYYNTKRGGLSPDQTEPRFGLFALVRMFEW